MPTNLVDFPSGPHRLATSSFFTLGRSSRNGSANGPEPHGSGPRRDILSTFRLAPLPREERRASYGWVAFVCCLFII